MEYKVLSGPFNAGKLESDLNGHAAEGWRVAGTFQAISWMKSRTPTASARGPSFHADPHPGNVLLLAEGRLGLLDFGSVGRIDAGLRTALQRLLLALDRGDPAGLAAILALRVLVLVFRPDTR